MYADLCNSCRCAAVIAYSHLERDWSVQPLEWKLRRSSVDVKKTKLLGVTSEKAHVFILPTEETRTNQLATSIWFETYGFHESRASHSKWRLVAKLSEGEMTCSQTWSASSLAFSCTLQMFIWLSFFFKMRVSKAAVTAIRQAGYGTYYKYGPSSVIICKFNSSLCEKHYLNRLKYVYNNLTYSIWRLLTHGKTEGSVRWKAKLWKAEHLATNLHSVCVMTRLYTKGVELIATMFTIS